MTIEELEQTLEWNACTVKQQMWLHSFIASNGNALLATKQAYASGPPQTGDKDKPEDKPKDLYAQMFSHQVRRNPHVRAVLNLYFGRSERDAFIDRLQRQIERGDMSVAQWNAIKLLCRLKGWAAVPAGDLDEAAEPENNSEPPVAANAPKSPIPTGCDPIVKAGKVVGYFTPEDRRVDF